MLLPLDELRRYDIAATDGSIGDVHDIYFDDRYWIVRYIVADTGKWLPGRKVLIGPEAVEALDPRRNAIQVSLGKKDIEEGPGISADLPVSRQNEIALRRHYSWPNYWEAYLSGTAAAPLVPTLQPRAAVGEKMQTEEEPRPRGDPNLRSGREVTGYHIAARDGDIGHVEDLMVDDAFWTIRYIVVDTRNWLPGRKVLIAPAWARGVDWSERTVHIDADRKTIEDSPPYDPGAPVSRDYETAIYEYYGGRPYWV